MLEFKVNKQGQIAALAIDFRQVNQGSGVLLGSIRYHSSIPVKADLYTLNERSPLEITMESHQDYIGQNQKYHYNESAIPFFTPGGSMHLGVDG